MVEIVPCITVETDEEYKASVERLMPFAKRVHIDIADGELAPTSLMASGNVWWPAEWETDIHAMVARPSEYVDMIQKLKPNLVVFHAEVQENLLPTIQQLQQVGIRVGVALQRPTVPVSVAQYIERADHVMIFSGDLGHYGGTASMMQLEKVRLIKEIRQDVEIGWDGGINIDNAFSLSHGGVNVLNVGGTIARSDTPQETYQTLVNEIHKEGVAI